jgi:hypothetical protein
VGDIGKFRTGRPVKIMTFESPYAEPAPADPHREDIPAAEEAQPGLVAPDAVTVA